jgi:hypothetical protein
VEWLHEQDGTVSVVTLPDGEVRLPTAAHFFEATTLYFGRNTGRSMVCSSRFEAELLAAIANTGLRGEIPIPCTEQDWGKSRKNTSPSWPGVFDSTRGRIHYCRPTVIFVFRLQLCGGPYIDKAVSQDVVGFFLAVGNQMLRTGVIGNSQFLARLCSNNQQAAPNLKVSPKAFGVGRIFPVAQKYQM